MAKQIKSIPLQPRGPDTTWRQAEEHRRVSNPRGKQSGQRPGPLVTLFFMTLLASTSLLRAFNPAEKGPPSLFPPIPDDIGFGGRLSLIPPPPCPAVAPEPMPTLSPSSISLPIRIRSVPIPAPLPEPTPRPEPVEIVNSMPMPTTEPDSALDQIPAPLPELTPRPEPVEIVNSMPMPTTEPNSALDPIPAPLPEPTPNPVLDLDSTQKPIPAPRSTPTPSSVSTPEPTLGGLLLESNNEEQSATLKYAVVAAAIAAIASPLLNPSAPVVALKTPTTLPPSRSITESIIIGRRKYTIITKLPLGTSDEQVGAFKEAFRSQILEKIIKKEGFDITQNFTVSFPEKHAFSVTTKGEVKEPMFFEVPEGAQEKQQLRSLREILAATSSPKSIPAEKLQICWKTLESYTDKNKAPVVSLTPQRGTSPHGSKEALRPQTNSSKDIGQPTPIKVVPQTVSSKQPRSTPAHKSQNAPISQPKPPPGIPGGNNNCWANAMLQLLLSSTELSKQIRDKSNLNSKLIPLREFYKAYDTALKQKTKKQVDFETQKIRTMVSNLAANLSQTGQEDLHEGLLRILNKLNVAETNVIEIKKSYQDKPVSPTLSHRTKNHDVYPILALPLLTGKSSLQSLMNGYFTETHDANKVDKKGVPLSYITNRDDSIPGASKGQLFYGIQTTQAYVSAPPELWISLKRWNADTSKNSATVEIPHEVTVPLTDGSTKKYKLQATANHLGSTQLSGHYTTERWIGDQCYLCNDSSVKLLPDRKRDNPISSETAYVLYYELIS